jgi:E3 ubiquitin-protein ligase SIAH1
MASVTSELRRVLLGELECQLCLEYMLPPIYVCVNGHNICKSCKPEIKCCPTCKQMFAPMRCVSLEKLSAQVDFPCTNRNSGCKKTMRGDSLNEHQTVCTYGTYSCPFNCPGRFNRLTLVQHVKNEHEQILTKSIYSSYYVKILGYSLTKKYTDVIVTNIEVFVRTIIVTNGIWYFLVRYIGPVRNAGRFSYTVAFESRDSNVASILITHRCQSINEDVDEIYRACKCIMLPAEVVKCSLQDGQLCYRFRIGTV